MMTTRMPCHVRIAVFFAFAVLNKNTIALRNKKQNTSRKINWQQPREMTLLTHASDHKNTYKCTLYDAFITPARNSASTNVSPHSFFSIPKSLQKMWQPRDDCAYIQKHAHTIKTLVYFHLPRGKPVVLSLTLESSQGKLHFWSSPSRESTLDAIYVKDYKKIKIKKIERAHQQNTWYSLGCVIK